MKSAGGPQFATSEQTPARQVSDLVVVPAALGACQACPNRSDLWRPSSGPLMVQVAKWAQREGPGLRPEIELVTEPGPESQTGFQALVFSLPRKGELGA